MKRLGVNIDHVATLRNARGETHPSPLLAAKMAIKCGADSVTIHLRDDRRHIKDSDLLKIKQKIVSQMKIDVPIFTKNKLPTYLKSISIIKPGSRYIR